MIACDIPSGVDGATGEITADAVRADATATFHAAKPGLWIAPGKAHAGDVRVVDIGIPPGAPAEADVGLIEDRVTGAIPVRGRESTKFAAGSVLVCGGSLGLTGAPSMASESAMRSGAGYVTALVPASLNLVFESRLLEAMTVPLPDADGSLVPEGVDTVLGRVPRADALVLGPGLGREPGALEFARIVASAAELPLLLDADGLNAHAGRLSSLARRPAATVLTPHAGELARLLESDSAAIGARRLHSARRAAVESGAIIVLKGDDTIVAEPLGPRRRQPRRLLGARDRRNRRRAVGRDRGVSGQGDGAVCGRVRGRARPRPRRARRSARDRPGGRDRRRRDRRVAAGPAGGSRQVVIR